MKKRRINRRKLALVLAFLLILSSSVEAAVAPTGKAIDASGKSDYDTSYVDVTRTSSSTAYTVSTADSVALFQDDNVTTTSSSSGAAIRLNASGASADIIDSTINATNGGRAVDIALDGYSYIDNNTITATNLTSSSAYGAIYLRGDGSSADITNNTINVTSAGNASAIRVGSSSNTAKAYIANNNISAEGNSSIRGIYVVNGDATINNNTVSSSGIGIEVAEGATADANDNAIAVTDSGVGVKTYGAATLNGNEISSVNGNAVQVESGGSLVAEGNTISVTGSGRGINFASGSAEGTVKNNKITVNSGRGLSVVGATVTAEENTITTTGDGSYGVYAYSGSTTLTGNTINAGGDGSYGVYVRNGATAEISGNKISANGTGSRGVNVVGKATTITDNTISSADGDAVFIGEAGSVSEFSGNKISASGTGRGVYIGGTVTTVTGNTISSADGDAVYLASTASTDTVSGNNITVTGDGNGINYTDKEITVTDNEITVANGYGISVGSGGSLNASGNKITVTDGGRGINFASGSAEGAVNNNEITVNSGRGLSVVGATVTAEGNTITTTGDGSYGVYAYSGSTTLTGNTIDAGGDGSYGVYVRNGATAEMSGNTISATGSGYGAYISGSATITDNTISSASGDAVYVTSTGSATVTASTIEAEGSGRGIYVYGGNASINNNSITVEGGHAITFTNDAAGEAKGNVINVTGTETSSTTERGRGIVLGANSAEISGNTINTGSNVGIYVSGDASQSTVSENEINVGDEGYGMYVTSAGAAAATDNTIEAEGSGRGVYVYGGDASINDNSITVEDGYAITFTNDATGEATNNVINVTGTETSSVSARGRGIVLGANSANISNNTINAGSNVGIYVSGDASNATVSGNEITTADGYGVYSGTGGSVNLTNGNVITATGSAKGLYAYTSTEEEGASSKIYADSTTVISVEGAEATNYAVQAANKGSDITLDNVTINNSGSGRYLLRVTGGGTISLQNYDNLDTGDNHLVSTWDSGTLNMTDSTVTGNAYHTGSNAVGNLDINLVNSEWTGKATVASSGDYSDGSSISVNIDSGSTWNMTDDSKINGDLTIAGTLNAGDYKATVSTATFDNGTLNMNVSDSAAIEASGAVTGSGLVNVTVPELLTEDSVTLISGGEGSDLSGLKVTGKTVNSNGNVESGAWQYKVSTEDDDLSLVRGGLSVTGAGLVSVAGLASHVWDIETNALFGRLGIYRDNLYGGGFWITGAFSKLESESASAGDDDYKFKSGIIGYDMKYRNETGTWWSGVMLGFGKSTQDIAGDSGSNDLKSYFAAVYGVWRGRNGFYGAGIVKANHYDTDVVVNNVDLGTASAGFDKTTGNFRQNGYGAAFMAGQRIDLGKNSKGWYVEPQLQVSWNHIGKGMYTTNSGINVEVNALSYIKGRAGLMLGKTSIFGNGSILDLNVTASIARDFTNDAKIVLSSGVYKTELASTYGIYSFGANYRYAKGKFFNFRLDYADGGYYTSDPLIIYAGLSYEL